MKPTTSFAALATTAFMTLATVSGANAADRGYSSGYDRHGSKARVAMINFRISNQHRRIRFGRRSGKLTWVEARKLRFELSHIRGFRARYLRDGWLSRPETRHLKRLLGQNSRRIKRLASNGFRWDRRRARTDYGYGRRDRNFRLDRHERQYQQNGRFRNRIRDRADNRRNRDRLSRLNGFH